MVTPASINKNIILNKNNSTKKSILLLLNNNIYKNNIEKSKLQKLINGLFQAEGHIGGYFYKKDSHIFYPIIFISLNASIESIELFKLLNKEFDNKLNYQISLNKSGIFHIRIYTKSWDILINKLIPYLKYTYGDKKRGIIYLRKIYYIRKSINIEDIIKKIYLIYNLVDNSQRIISLEEKIQLINNKNIYIDNNYYINYMNNIKIINNYEDIDIIFILGLFIGDGNIYFRIRLTSENNLPWYISILRINQKYTEDNKLLLENINKYLLKYNIKSYIKEITKVNNYKKIEIIIENKDSIKNLIKIFNEYKLYYFNRKELLEILYKISLLNGKLKFWKEPNIIILNILKNYKMSLSTAVDARLNIISNDKYYKILNIINNIFDKRSFKYFISESKEAYIIKLPINIKPKQKYIYFRNFENKDIALKIAINYRDTKLNDWLIENNLK